jgi:hypothetical protein
VGLTEKFIGNDEAIADFKEGMEGVGTAIKSVVGAGVIAKNTFDVIGKTIAAAAAQFLALGQGDFVGAKAIGAQWLLDMKGDLGDVMKLFDEVDARSIQPAGLSSPSSPPSSGPRNSGYATTDDLKNQAAMVKQIFAELQAETKAATTLNQEMYEQLGIGAENVAKDEVQALMERAQKWQEAGADIWEINDWLYKNIEELRLKWAENGEQDAVNYLDSVTALHHNLVDEYTKMEQEAVAALDQIGVRMDLLDKQDITLDIYLADHASAQIEAIISRVRAMQAEGLALQTSIGGTETRTFVTPVTNNFTQNLSRSDVVNITTEQGRLLNRN